MFKSITTSEEHASTAAQTRTPSAKGALAGLSLAMLLSSLGTSSANVALPILAQAFNASFPEVQWIVLAYLLAITTLIVSVGRLGDITGRKTLLLIGLALFTVASVLCGIAPTLGSLIISRAVQGLGAAIMMALAMALVREAVPQDKLGRALGMLGSMSAVGTALGPSLGGMLIAGLGWRAIFYVNVPLGILTWALTRRHLPADGRAAKGKWTNLDVTGSFWLASSLGAYALAMTMGRGNLGTMNGALLIAAVVGVGLFMRAEAKASSPLIELSLFRVPTLSISLAMSALVATVIMATLVVGPFYLSRALGLDAALVGLVMTTGPLVAAVTAAPSGSAVDRLGTLHTTVIGLATMTVGSLALSATPVTFGIIGYIVPLALVTAGYALFQTANNTAVMSEVQPEQRGVMSGMLNLSRNLGLITGSSLMGAVFAIASGTSDIRHANAEAVTSGMQTTFGSSAMLTLIALAIAVAGRIWSQRSSLPSPEVTKVRPPQ